MHVQRLDIGRPLLAQVRSVLRTTLFTTALLLLAARSWAIAPIITRLTPAAATTGSTVTIKGDGFTGLKKVKFNGVVAVVSTSTATSITAVVPDMARTGKVSVATLEGTAKSPKPFKVLPSISSFSPSSGLVGSSFTVNGGGLFGATSVTIGGAAATFTVASPVQITVTTPANAITGAIVITTPAGRVTSGPVYTVLPSISDFTPTSGIVGSSFTVNGGGLFGTTSVTLGGTAASFTVVSPAQLMATVPDGAVTGVITVTTPGGAATSGPAYTVLPHIESFLPPAASIGDGVTIAGTGFNSVTGVTFNSQAAAYVVDSPTRITATVPLTTSGPIMVTTTSGTDTTETSFTVLPSLVLRSSSGPPTGTVVVDGYGFSPFTLVDIFFDMTSVAQVGADWMGSFLNLTLAIPATALPGLHQVSGVARGSDIIGQAEYTVNTNWSMFRNTASHRGWNPYENVVGTANASNLVQLWAAPTNGVPTSPAVVDGIMYAGSADFNLYAFDAASGEQLWSFATTAAISASPAVANGVVYAVSSDGNLWAVDALTGQAIWASPVTLSSGTSSSPTISGGRIYLGTTNGSIYAIDQVTGTVNWTDAPGAGSIGTSPAVAYGVVVFTTASGRAVAYNASVSGGLLWNTNLGGSLTTPLIVSGSVYAGSSNWNFYSVNLVTGVLQWTIAPSGAAFLSAPSYAKGRIFIGSNDGLVYALDTLGGEVWSGGEGTAYQSPTTVANDVVYAGSNDNGIYAYNVARGQFLWSATTGGQVKASPVIVNGRLYVASNDGHVYAYGIATDMMATSPRLGP